MDEFGINVFLGASLLVHAAGLLQLAGYLFRDQLALRLLLLCGTVFYGLYYYLHPAIPLWEAIGWSMALAAANIAGCVALIMDRRRLRGSDAELELYAALPGLNPGEFRRLMRFARIEVFDRDTPIVTQGGAPDALRYLLDGPLRIEVDGAPREAPPQGFIGEISFISGGVATATVTAGAGARLVAWPVAPLRALMARDPIYEHAFSRAFGATLAEKIRRLESRPNARRVDMGDAAESLV